MCGIVGYTGAQNATTVLFDGLKKLEYRGYDSSGIATLRGKIFIEKAKGRISHLREKSENGKNLPGNVGIGHTRWATHGAPSDANAHPMLSFDKKFALVHNGIIENYASFKPQLIADGIRFTSETDSEVIVHLIAKNYSSLLDPIKAIKQTVECLKGSFALCILCDDYPGTIFAVRRDSPLVIGAGSDFNMVASDIPAIADRVTRFILPEEYEIAVVNDKEIKIYGEHGIVPLKYFSVTDASATVGRGEYEHFMLKEMHEQANAIESLASDHDVYSDLHRFFSEKFGGLPQKIDLIGCGSAYHAALSGKYFIEKFTRICTNAYLAGEYRYGDPITGKNTLSVIISQSGETADSLAALREAKKRLSPVLCIVNAKHSSIARESDCMIFENAGAEIAVATTKGYTTQLAALYMLGIALREQQGRDCADMRKELAETGKAANRSLTDCDDTAKAIASALCENKNAFFIGRGVDYAPACEGALKLKEISYIHAEAYAASELKHGTISLIDDGVPVIALATDAALYGKLISGIKEVKARGAWVAAITNDNNNEFCGDCRFVITVPECAEHFGPIVVAPVLQMISYYTALRLGRDIDKPRNLAKSVTVE